MAANYNLNILSATLGAVDVTKRLRDLYQASLSSNLPNQWKLQVNRGALAPGTSWPPQATKLTLIIVWSVGLSSAVPSAFQVAQPVPLEGDSYLINYSGTSLQPFTPPVLDSTQIYLISAYWYNQSVYDKVKSMIGSGPASGTSIAASVPNFGDPAKEVTKSLTVTYGYKLPNGEFEYNTISAWEGQSIKIRFGPAPPRLLIHAANFGGVDYTSQFRQLISFDQTVNFVPSTWDSLGWQNPWPNGPSSLSMAILYQWDTRPLELALVSSTDTSPLVLDPSVAVNPLRYAFFNPTDTRNAGETNILAITWGIMKDQTKSAPYSLFDFTEINNYFIPSDIWFTFDGWFGVQKVAVVFYQYGITGPIQATAARERGPNGVLTDRGSQPGNPLPGRGLLRYDTIPTGLRFQTSTDGKYVRLDPATGALVADGTVSQAIGINVTSAASGNPIVQFFDPSGSLIGYATIANNGQVIATKDAKAARNVHYELPGESDARGMMISFPQNTIKDSPLDLTLLPSASGPSGPKLWAIPHGSMVYGVGPVAYNDSVFILDNAPGTASDSGTLAIGGALVGDPEDDPIIDPWILGLLSVIKDLVWDLPILLFAGGLNLSNRTIMNGIIKWWGNLSTAIKTKITSVITAIKLAIGDKPTVLQMLQSAGNLVIAVHDANMLWGFFKTIMAGALSWVDLIVFIVNALKFNIKLVTGTETFALLVDVAVWITRTITDIVGFAGLTRPAMRVVSIVSQTLHASRFMDLPFLERMLVSQALLEPHMTRTNNGGTAKPPVEHLREALQKIIRSSVIPEDPALREYQRTNGILLGKAATLVEELRPRIEQELLASSIMPEEAALLEHHETNGVLHEEHKTNRVSVGSSEARVEELKLKPEAEKEQLEAEATNGGETTV